MTAIVATTVKTLEVSVTNVDETAWRAPTTSLFIRDINSPVFVFVKNPMDCLRTCPNNWRRRSRMIPNPMVADARV